MGLGGSRFIMKMYNLQQIRLYKNVAFYPIEKREVLMVSCTLVYSLLATRPLFARVISVFILYSSSSAY
jgi:hypothetical protein